MAYHRYHGVKTRIVRIFNTYGPRMRLNDGRVLPAFMGQVLRGEPLTVFGKGDQTRSFCYVTDLVDGIYRLLHSDFTEPVNIGNPAEITVLELAKEIIAMVPGTKSTDRLPATFPRTTPSAGSPTSPAPRPCSAGTRPSIAPTGCGGPSSISGPSSEPCPTEYDEYTCGPRPTDCRGGRDCAVGGSRKGATADGRHRRPRWSGSRNWRTGRRPSALPRC